MTNVNRSITQETRTVTLRGESREVTFTVCTFEDGRQHCATSNANCAYQKGNGKIWFGTLTFLNNCGRTDWEPRRLESFLNRNGYRLIGWADQFRGINDSKHHSA